MATIAFDINNLPETEEDIDFSDIEAKYELPEARGFENIVIIDNLPKVDEKKQEKLTKVLKNILKPVGTIVENGIQMPRDEESNKTKGFAFVEFANAEQANLAIRKINNYPLDKSHNLAVNLFNDFEFYMDLEDEFEEPEEEPYEEKEHLKSWLTDPFARDQLSIYAGDFLGIYWNQRTDQPETIHQRQNWTETYTQWSPKGSYLVTLHRPGVAIWGGPSWKKIMRFVHPNVKLIDFSHNERYLVTWSSDPLDNKIVQSITGGKTPFSEEDEGNHAVIWDTHTGAVLRTFPNVPNDPKSDTPAKIHWPMFKWSPSDHYFARITRGQMISIYEAPGMGLLGKKSVKIDGVVDFEWCLHQSKKDLMVYWTPEISNQPARVSIMSIPTKDNIRVKNLFNVKDCKFYWQPQGHYLCVKVDRHTKSKKSFFTNLEIFRLKEKDIPVEVIERKDTAIAFAWEPQGERFAVISTSDPSPPAPNAKGMNQIAMKTTVSFYAPEKNKSNKIADANGFKLIETFEKKTTNSVLWSPRGRHLVLATLRTQNICDLEFWDLDFETSDNKKDPTKFQLLATVEHYGVTDAEWDPTGRYFLTSASAWRHSLDNGYILWDFKGTKLYSQNIERLFQVLWRPRPKSLLSEEQKRKIRKNLAQYSKGIEAEDLSSQKAYSAATLDRRRKLIDEWNAFRKRAERQITEERNFAMGRWGTQPLPAQAPNLEVIEEWIEEVIEETEEVIE